MTLGRTLNSLFFLFFLYSFHEYAPLFCLTSPYMESKTPESEFLNYRGVSNQLTRIVRRGAIGSEERPL
ncbi:MAG: hypothetical protein ACW97X_11160 [Candidatus Hodarchaeales archaeon]